MGRSPGFYISTLLLFLLLFLSCKKSGTAQKIEKETTIPEKSEQVSGTDITVSIYVDDNYPPYSFSQKGIVRGIYPDILQKAAPRLQGYTLRIIAVPWKRGLAYLKSGKGFALLPPYYRPELRPYMDYSVPILAEELVVLYREEIESSVGENWPEGYYGLRIGINQGFASIPEELRQSGQMIITEAENSRINLLNLGKGRLDCYVNDKIAMLWTLQNLKRSGEYDEGGLHSVLKVGASISREQGHLGITTMDEGAFYYKKDFLQKFNNIIMEMKAVGEIDKIVQTYIE